MNTLSYACVASAGLAHGLDLDDLFEPFQMLWWSGVSLLFLGLLVVYYVLLARAIPDMLERDAHTVLLVFAFVALIPVPPIIVMGVVLLIIWSSYKKRLPEGGDHP